MAPNRRDFLKQTGLASAGILVPSFIKASVPFLPGDVRPKVLVMIQFTGGNDGLNCIVPIGNDLYHKARPNIGYKKEELIKLSDDIGMNANLQGLADLFYEGNVVLINNVGYPDPNRSHFRSMDIWQTASDENVYMQTGWIGRMLDQSCKSGDCQKPHFAVEIDDSLSLALKGESMSGFAVRNPDQLKNVNLNPFIDSVARSGGDIHTHDNVGYLHKLLTDTTESTDYIYDQSKKYTTAFTYPTSEFAAQLKIIANLINAETNTSVYYVSLSGFDTHALQRGQQERQLRIYSEALQAFTKDLKSTNRFKDTLIMTFSEFGRRVEENAGKGTDHGTANNVYLIGGGMKQGGMINDMPDLSKLVDDDLVYQTDFRNIYATILDKWLEVPSKEILGRDFARMDFL
ncbi:MAG TPA: DUF1501 domain-containing protein [Chitinophagales bacterium]|nr:DUF1501 domain-containing protein [Chitinophagales bacterium]HMU70075.1 DUF1501 domain-containing protein [Chitinophagales bacterium]HNA58173.1 DUF1501 domain-containing protein [Chitinophagales bacterium]HNE47077.1 DUF1501 domain-containing protein [Chitinophagales bacterium]HNF70073.1 DUF1501 domain-containing protein [Chitinophagales bacterium]